MGLADLINRADVGMIESGSGTCLTPEALQSSRITGHQLREKLQRDKAAKFRVFGFIDHTHPTAAQLLDDAVMGEGLADYVKASPVAIVLSRHCHWHLVSMTQCRLGD